jgi:hypothetical protein
MALQAKIHAAGAGAVDDATLGALHRMVTVGSDGLHLHYLHLMDFHLAWDVLVWLGPRPPPYQERVRPPTSMRNRAKSSKFGIFQGPASNVELRHKE